jgi:hypothetical protein
MYLLSLLLILRYSLVIFILFAFNMLLLFSYALIIIGDIFASLGISSSSIQIMHRIISIGNI